MRAIHFEGANATYGKPDDMTDEECYSVSAYEHRDTDGNVAGISTVWQPNREDIQAINAGRPVVLHICGAGMPPVSLFTYDENGVIND